MNRNVFKTLLILMLGLMAGAKIYAAATPWDGGGGTTGGNANWGSNNNWNPNGVPASGTSVSFGTGFGSGTTIDLNGNRTIGTLTFNTTTNVDLINSTLTINGGTITVTAGDHVIDSSVILGANTTIDIAAGASLTINGNISQTTAGTTITKTGAGTLQLGGANTYSGGTTVNGGTLSIASNSTGTVTNGPVGTGTLTMNTGTTLTVDANDRSISNNVVLNGAVTYNHATNKLTFDGVISGSGTLTVTGYRIRVTNAGNGTNFTLAGTGNTEIEYTNVAALGGQPFGMQGTTPAGSHLRYEGPTNTNSTYASGVTIASGDRGSLHFGTNKGTSEITYTGTLTFPATGTGVLHTKTDSPNAVHVLNFSTINNMANGSLYLLGGNTVLGTGLPAATFTSLPITLANNSSGGLLGFGGSTYLSSLMLNAAGQTLSTGITIAAPTEYGTAYRGPNSIGARNSTGTATISSTVTFNDTSTTASTKLLNLFAQSTGTTAITGSLQDGPNNVAFGLDINGGPQNDSTGIGTVYLNNTSGTPSQFSLGVNVNGGTLLVDNTTVSQTLNNTVTINGSATNPATFQADGLVSGSVTVNANGTLRGLNAGTITGAVTVAGGTVAPGNATTVGTLDTGALTNSNTASTYTFRLGSPAQAPTAPINSDRIAVTGGLTMTTAGNVSLSTGTGFGVGTYTLFTYTTGAKPAATSFPVTTALPAGYDGYIDTNTAGQVNLVVTLATPVTLRSFKAQPAGLGGVYLEWETATELLNFGFNLYRRKAFDPEGQWERINDTLIAGRLTKQSAHDYQWFDFGEGVYEYRLESISMRRDREQFPKDGPLLAESGEGSKLSNDARLALQEKLERDLKNKLMQELIENIPPGVEPLTVSDRRSSGSGSGSGSGFTTLFNPNGTDLQKTTPADDFLAAPANLAPAKVEAPKIVGPAKADASRFAKVVTHGQGVLKIPADQLPKDYDATKLYIEREGKLVRALSADKTGVVLWAPGYEDSYTDRDAFFAYKGVGATPVLTATPAPSAKITVGFNQGVYTQTEVYHDEHVDSFFDLLTYTPWFSSKILWENNSQSFPITVSNLGTGPAAFSLDLYSYYGNEKITPDHNVQVFINKTWVGGKTFDGDKSLTLNFLVPAGVLHNGENLVDLVVPPLANYPHEDWEYTQISFVHGMALNYPRALNFAVEQKSLAFKSLQSGVYEVNGLPGSKAWVVDVTDSNAILPLGYRATSDGHGGYTLRFSADALHNVWVVPEGKEFAPISVTPREFNFPSGNPDYVAVGPAQFGTSIQPLLKARKKQGLKTALLDQEDLFDDYNFGRYGPEAIRQAMIALKPEYLLLLGRPTYDFKNFEGLNLDPLCPTFFHNTEYVAEAASDSKFGDLGKGSPEIAVGRFPVRSTAELDVAVQRTLNHRTNYGYGLQSMLVADRADDFAGNFANEAESIANNVDAIEWTRAYLGVNVDSADTVRSLVEEAVNQREADTIVYVGHGSSQRWSLEDILTLDTAGNWTGNAILLQACCNGNYFLANEDGAASIAAKLLTQGGGGIAASISTTTYLGSKPAVEFMTTLMNSKGKTWGKRLLHAQQWAGGKASSSPVSSTMWYQDLMWSETILGDPALPVLDDSDLPKTK